MTLVFDILYALGVPVAAPVLWWKGRKTGKYRTDWPARLGHGSDLFPKRAPGQKVLLLHCVSVGELLSVQTLITRLLEADPDFLLALSTTTDTGTARAQQLFPADEANLKHNPRVAAVRFPLDFSFAVESLFDRVRPDAIALVELETWPNFLAIAESRRIPVAIINGRLSERSFPRYQLIRPIMSWMLQKLSWLAVQTPAIAQRFFALGADSHYTDILPTLKYDNAPTGPTVPGQHELAAAMGLQPDHQLFVAGSIAPGEEDAVLDTYTTLIKQHPTLRLAIAPRHPETLPQMLTAIQKRGLIPILRTDRPDHNTQLPITNYQLPPTGIFLLNTLGELKKLYALAAFTFIGRSLVKLGGSDMIESAALGKPTSFGPHTRNFAEVTELLLTEKAAIEVQDAPTLTACIQNWLENPRAAEAMGEKARMLIHAQRGSTNHYVKKLLELTHHTHAPN